MGFCPLENDYEETTSVNVTTKFHPQFKLFKYIYRLYHIFNCLKSSYHGYEAHHEIISFSKNLKPLCLDDLSRKSG